MRVTFVRHAESTSNVSGKWQGQGDAPLSDRGREQAAALGRRLRARGTPFTRVVASDLSRAAETARAIGLPVALDAAWREIDVGAWEGLTREEVAERFPQQVEDVAKGRAVHIGGGETFAELGERIGAAYARVVAESAPEDHVLVVSHGGAIGALLARLYGHADRFPAGADGWQRWPLARLMNTAISSVVASEPGRAEIVVYNDATHLGLHSAWADERRARGIALLTLIAHEAGERAHGERLAAWYDEFDHLYSAPDDMARATAAALAARRGLTTSAIPDGAFIDAVWGLADAHRGARIAMVAGAEEIHSVAAALFGGTSPLRLCSATAVAHVIIGQKGRLLADWNLAPHLE
jgi:probable phosphoglycerate mutase